MHVKQVEAVRVHDFVHAHGERQVVRRILEQRVPADVHFVEVDAAAGTTGSRNGCWYVMKWISCPRWASAMPSSVATAPDPPYVG